MDPFTIGLAVAGLAGLYAFLRPAAAAAPTAKCDANGAVVSVAGAGVSGAATGAAAGPYGALIGAGVGVALGTTSTMQGRCGNEYAKNIKGKIAAIGKTTCEKADDLLNRAKSVGISKPYGWERMSCDQKIAAIELAIATGGFASILGESVGRTVEEANRINHDVTGTSTSETVGGGQAHVTIGGHRVF